jgi:uncharacterized membrane protein
MWSDNDGQWHMMGAGGDAAWGMLLLVFVLIVIVTVGTTLVLVRRSQGQGGADPATRILHDRLARGEIDELEYESRLRLIERDELQR